MRRRHHETEPGDRERAIMRDLARLSQRKVVDLDPEDPTQRLDDVGEIPVEPLDVEALTDVEQAEDFDLASAENVEGESEQEEPEDDALPDTKGTGELYGVRIPHAADPNLLAPEDRDGFEGADLGETWLESLQEHATELGPAPEEQVVIVDDSDLEHPDHRGHHQTEGGDPPVADKGSGGSGGL